ncbi:MAG: ABC transporter permease [Betaproteobacteria bacterium]
MLETTWHDLKYAARVLRRSPQTTFVAIAILAVAIGANTAMFSAISHVLLRPLPFADAGRILRVRDRVTATDGQDHAYNMPARHVLGLREGATAFDGVVAYGADSMTLAGSGDPERVSVVLENDDRTSTLGVMPIAGRSFSAEERQIGISSGAALISYAMWQARFGARRDAIGRRVLLDGRPFTIVGVMPAGYAFPYEAQFWLPTVLDPADRAHDFAVFCRLRSGVTFAQARDSLRAVADAIRAASPDVPAGYGLDVMTIRENVVGDEDAPLRALSDVVAFLLLVACVNVATLLLARSVGRRREFAIRSALGAGRARHVRQLLAESVVLAAAGCAAGLLLAAWIVPLTSTLVPSPLRGQLGLSTPVIDWRVLLFAAAASLGSAAIAGVVPAFGSSRVSPRLALAEGGRTSSAGVGSHRLLGALMVAETALTLILLSGAGVVIRHFVRLQTTALGFDAHGLLAMEVAVPPGYRSAGARSVLIRQILERVRATPGVVTAGVTTVNPLGGGTWGASVATEEMAARNPDTAMNVNHRLITPGLLHAMGIPLLGGRDFADADREGAAPVVIVSDRLAGRFWPGEEAIGRRIRSVSPGAPWLTVIGVAGDVSDSHDPGVPLETWYLPYAQNAATAAAGHVYVMTRTRGDAMAATPAVRHAITAVDGTLAPYGAAAMDHYYAGTISRDRASALFMLGFGSFGLVLAALGVYGVMAFSVSQRTAEIGIRMALGARAAQIVPLVLRRAVALVAGGVALGVAGALALNRVLASLLTDVGPADRAVLGGAAALILAAGVIACLVPALRAAYVDPAAALSENVG